MCHSKQTRLLSTIGQIQEQHKMVNCSSLAAMVEACVELAQLPAKLNPIVRPLMEAVKAEHDDLLHRRWCVCVCEWCVRVCVLACTSGARVGVCVCVRA